MREGTPKRHLTLVHSERSALAGHPKSGKGLTPEEKTNIENLYRTGITPKDVSAVSGIALNKVKKEFAALDNKSKLFKKSK